MNALSVDWKYDSISRILDALSENTNERLEFLRVQHDDETITFDPDDEMSFFEEILGVCFIVAQTYITMIISQHTLITNPDSDKVNFDSEKYINEAKTPLMGSDYSQPVCATTKTTQIEFCNAVANYFKHHDEWDGWGKKKKNKQTINAIESVGINESTERPCESAARLLGFWDDDGLNSDALLAILKTWRKKIFQEVNRRLTTDILNSD